MSQLEVDKIIPQSGTTLTIGDSGDTINFADGQNINIDSNTLYIDSTNNRVGIGTSSPTSPLMVQTNDYTPIHVKGANTKTILVETTDGETGITLIQLKNSAYTWNIENGRRANTLTFYANSGAERMCIDSSGNVGIGTSSPDGKLDISAPQTTSDKFTSPHLALTSSSQSNNPEGFCGISYSSSTAVNYGWTVGSLRSSDGDGSSYFTFTNHYNSASGNERVRIDSPGNLLVGTTSNIPGIGNTTLGASLRNNNGGSISASRGSDNAGYFNRNTSDGSIISLRKNGTEVGRIGVANTNNLFIQGDSTNSGLQCGTNTILPVQNDANADNTIDLGMTGIRWKDIYLGGGLYVGGTGTANKLDDYEEGTWTGTISDGTNNATMGSNTGSYIKVGSLVFLSGYFTVTSLGSVSGNLRLTGLPFANGSSNDHYTANGGGWGANMNLTDDTSIGFQIDTSAVHINLSNWDNISGTTNLQASELSANGQFMLNLTYRTDA
jgi:hypothetical protein